MFWQQFSEASSEKKRLLRIGDFKCLQEWITPINTSLFVIDLCVHVYMFVFIALNHLSHAVCCYFAFLCHKKNPSCNSCIRFHSIVIDSDVWFEINQLRGNVNMEARKLGLGPIVLGSIQVYLDTLTFLDWENVGWGELDTNICWASFYLLSLNISYP